MTLKQFNIFLTRSGVIKKCVISVQWITNRNHEFLNICGFIEKKRETVYRLRAGPRGTWFKKKTRSKKSHATVPSIPNSLLQRSDSLRKNYLCAVIHCARIISAQWITAWKWVYKNLFIFAQWFTAGELSLCSDSLRENHSSLKYFYGLKGSCDVVFLRDGEM